MIQAFEAGAIGGERTPAVGRDRASVDPADVEPDRDAVAVDRRTVLHIGEHAAT